MVCVRNYIENMPLDISIMQVEYLTNVSRPHVVAEDITNIDF